jgi:HK97 family phage prohead protease
VSDHNAIRTTAKEAKHGVVLYAEGDQLGHGESECGYWRERDLGDGRVLLEWVDEKDAGEGAAEDGARAYTGIRGRDWLAPTPPRRPKRDWLAQPPVDRPWLLPDTPPARKRDWLAPSSSLEPSRLPEPLSLGSWTNPHGAGVGLPVVGRMVPFNEWTEVRSAKEGNFFERFAPGSLSKSITERGARIRALFQHGTDALLGRQPIAAIEEMWEREEGAHYRSRLLSGVPELVVSGLRAGLYGSSVSFRARRFERVSHPRRSMHNPDGLEERTITEADVYEFSFVTFPQYEGATARVEET